jgi:hypothetical protein
MHSSDVIERFNELLAEMDQGGSLDAGLRLAKLFMTLVTPAATQIDLDEIQDSKVLDVLGLGNSKMDSWFVPHPYLGGHYTAFQLFDDASKLVEAKFYQLSQRVSKQLIAGAVHLTPNWEDSSLLTQDGDWRVGIDFFLTQDARALLVVLSLEGNLRVVELSERLTSTQAGILTKVSGAGDLITHEAVHGCLWDAFEIREVNKEFYRGVAAFFDELREKLIKDMRPEEDAKLFASRLIGRLLFVWFLRRKGLIADIPAYFDATGRTATKYYDDVLKTLFFNTLNTPVKERVAVKDVQTPYLNGGLFEYQVNDWPGDIVEFPQGFFTRLYDHFDRFNFTTDESSPDYEQVAIDPEMLGRHRFRLILGHSRGFIALPGTHRSSPVHPGGSMLLGACHCFPARRCRANDVVQPFVKRDGYTAVVDDCAELACARVGALLHSSGFGCLPGVAEGGRGSHIRSGGWCSGGGGDHEGQPRVLRRRMDFMRWW